MEEVNKLLNELVVKEYRIFSRMRSRRVLALRWGSKGAATTSHRAFEFCGSCVLRESCLGGVSGVSRDGSRPWELVGKRFGACRGS